MIEHTEQQWARMGSFYKSVNECFGQPIMDLVELNMQTWNRSFTENNKCLEKFLDVKGPEGLSALFTDLANKSGREITRYSQELFNIASDATSAMFKFCNTVAHETVKTGETFKAAAENIREKSSKHKSKD